MPENTDIQYWIDVATNLKDAYKRLSSYEVTEISVNGRTFKYLDRSKLLKEIRIAESKAGTKRAQKRIVVSM